MNTKHIIALGLLLTAATGSTFAQKSKIREANKAYDKAREAIILGNKEEAAAQLTKAKEAADAALANTETSGEAAAWMAKAVTYISMSQLPQFQEEKPYIAGFEALQKAVSIDPKIERKTDGIESVVNNAGIYAFNDGIGAFNNNKYDNAVAAFNVVQKAFDYNGGAYIDESQKASFDTVKAQANLYSAYSSYYLKNYTEALPKLEKAMANPITNDAPDVYRVVALAYSESKQPAKQLATLEAGIKKFPNNKDLAADELNYYIAQGKEDLLVKKFEDAVAKDPSNAQFISNLGILYRDMAKGKDGQTPENAEELFKKSEANLRKAASLDPNNAVYQYQLGNMFVQKADYIATKMNALGTSKADNAKYDGLFNLRNSYLKESLTPFEATVALLEPKQKAGKISTEEKGYFLETLQAMGKIYAAVNEPAKSAESKAKLMEYDN